MSYAVSVAAVRTESREIQDPRHKYTKFENTCNSQKAVR